MIRLVPFAALGLAAGCPEPTCIPIGGTVTHHAFVNCPGPVACDYSFDMTGGIGGLNNYVSYGPTSGTVNPPGALVDFPITGTNETDSIWLQKTWLNCAQEPCTTVVGQFEVHPTCPAP